MQAPICPAKATRHPKEGGTGAGILTLVAKLHLGMTPSRQLHCHFGRIHHRMDLLTKQSFEDKAFQVQLGNGRENWPAVGSSDG